MCSAVSGKTASATINPTQDLIARMSKTSLQIPETSHYTARGQTKAGRQKGREAGGSEATAGLVKVYDVGLRPDG
jgi:hypothetical protein